MAYDIDALPGLIELGHLNEKGVSEIQFDVSAWLALYPTGEFSVTYIRPGETDVYPVDGADLSVATVGLITTLTWTVSDAVTAIAGSGSAVVQCAVGSTIVKRSDKVHTIVSDGHAASGTAPEPLADYIEKWSAVDGTLEMLAHDADPVLTVEQDSTGTHFGFEVPVGHPGVYVGAEEPTDPLVMVWVDSDAEYDIDLNLWSAADGTIEMIAPDADPTLEITQDEAGTHFDLGIPQGEQGLKGDTGAQVESAVFDGNDLLLTLDDASEVRLTDAKITLKGDQGDVTPEAEAAQTAAEAARDLAQGYAAQLQAGIGSPAGSYANLAAVNVADPAHDRVYLTLDDGKIAYYDSGTSAFVAGGVYQSVIVADGSVTELKIANSSVTPEKTTFITTAPNLFSGTYIFNAGMAYVGKNVTKIYSMTNGVCAAVEIEPGKQYTIRKGVSNRFRVAVFDADYDLNDYPPLYTVIIDDSETECSFTSTDDPDQKYLIIALSNNNTSPDLYVFEGDEYKLNDEIILNLSPYGSEFTEYITTVDDNNLFDGYTTGYVLYITGAPGTPPSYISAQAGGVIAIAQIQPGVYCTVTKYDASNRFRIGTLETAPNLAEAPVYLKRGFAIADSETTHTFLADETENYVVVAVSAGSEEPRLKIEQGTDSTDYVKRVLTSAYSRPDPFILKESIPLYALEGYQGLAALLSPVSSIKYWVNGLAGTYDAPSVIPSITQTLTSDIYSFYDALVTAFPNNVSKNVLGTDALSNEIREYIFSAPSLYPTTASAVGVSGALTKTPKRTKFLITTGVHGNEKYPVVAAARVFDEMCRNPSDLTDALRWNVDFHIIPVVNPSGFNANTRNNHNSVDLNRNIALDKVGLEDENVIVTDWLDDNLDAIFALDFHDNNYGSDLGSALPMTFCSSNEYATIALSLYRELTRKWSDRYSIALNGETIGYIANEINGGTVTRYAEYVGLLSTLSEVPRGNYFFSSDENETGRCNMEVFANFLVAVLRNVDNL